jgi:hypothetical protein
MDLGRRLVLAAALATGAGAAAACVPQTGSSAPTTTTSTTTPATPKGPSIDIECSDFGARSFSVERQDATHAAITFNVSPDSGTASDPVLQNIIDTANPGDTAFVTVEQLDGTTLTFGDHTYTIRLPYAQLGVNGPAGDVIGYNDFFTEAITVTPGTKTEGVELDGTDVPLPLSASNVPAGWYVSATATFRTDIGKDFSAAITGSDSTCRNEVWTQTR